MTAPTFSAVERRQAWRFPASLELRFPSGRGVTRNLSASGVLFETEESFALGAPISFSVDLKNLYPDFQVHLECQGRIARVERQDGKMHVAATIESYSFDPSERPGVQLAIPWFGSRGGTAADEPTRDRIASGDSSPQRGMASRADGDRCLGADGLAATSSPTDDPTSDGGLALAARRPSERRGIFRAWFRRNREAGSSTTEVIVHLTITAILASIAVELVGNVLQTGRARSAAHQVASAMQVARQYAISSFATYTVTLTGTTVAVTCVAACPPSAPSEAAEPILHGATTSTPTPPIGFGPLGVSSSPGSVVVTYPGAPDWEVRVSAAGRVRVCTPSCT